MTVVAAQKRRRWLLVCSATAVLCALPAVIGAIPASAVRIAPATLAHRIAGSAAQPFQGNAVATGSVGLPVLSQLADVSKLFDGPISLRIWYASPARWRVDTLATASERDVYQGRVAGQPAQTIWDSNSSQLTTVTGGVPARLPRGTDVTPGDLARRLLAEAGPSTMTALPSRRVAGISAAGLRLTPNDTDTTIGTVDIWADPRTGLPLEVAVTPVDASKPILVSRMLEISLHAPSTGVTTPPRPSGGIGTFRTNSGQATGVLRDLGLGPLPDTIAGLPRIDNGVYGPTGIAAYGHGFEQMIVLSLPGSTGFDVLRAAGAVGTQTKGLGGFVSATVTNPLLNVLVLHVGGSEDSVLVVGTVSTDVIARAASDLQAYESALS
jgi:hypothetical protein